ncbi:MAG: hypothetical protein CMF50_02660 [Legionellales bacterium]|nr:hypothetical protein [Legionellales bacterium]|tara:strand:- start:2157 stop:4283 length:2127 start_codon:yes stop_codon:yes gene_type:complete
MGKELSKHRILLIEDDLSARSSLLAMLANDFSHQDNLLEASSLPEGLILFEENTVDCILLGEQFLYYSDNEALDKFQQKQQALETPVVLLNDITLRKEDRVHTDQPQWERVPKQGVSGDELNRVIRFSIEHTKLNKKIRQIQHEQNLILECAGEGIIVTDKEGIITYVNQAGLDYLAANQTDLIGKHVKTLIADTKPLSAEHGSNNLINLPNELKSRMGIEISPGFSFLNIHNQPFPVEYSSTLLHDEDYNHLGMVILFQDISNRLKAEKIAAFHTCFDRLTELPNRDLFKEVITLAILEASKKASNFAVFHIDIDGFKKVNEALDEQSGDALLKAFANRLETNLYPESFLARFSGDEFGILIKDINSMRQVEHYAQSLLDSISDPFAIDGNELYVHASIGASVYGDNDASAETLLRQADIALQLAKENGRNSYYVHDKKANSINTERLKIASYLHRAIENQEFYLNLHPQYCIKQNKLLGFEVLLRWNNPDLGIVSPDKFIPIAEEVGLINQIDDWVLEQACQELSQWQQQHLIGDDFVLAVNISAFQLRQKDFSQKVKATLDSYNISPQHLEFELTETALMRSVDDSIEVLGKLRAMGVTISIDDFGTAYASLTYLKRLPVHNLKIDRSFVMDIENSQSDAKIVEAIIHLAHSLDLAVIAEGVETKAQLEFLQDHDCEKAQGYYFSKPTDVETATNLLRTMHLKVS